MTRAALVLSTLVSLAALGLSGVCLVVLFQQSEELTALRDAALTRDTAAGRPSSTPSAPPTSGAGTAPALEPPRPSPSVPLPAADLGADGEASMADVASRVSPAVVNISTVRGGGRAVRGPGGGGGGEAMGSGVIVAAEGLVITNHHVIAGGGAIEVTLADGRELGADLVGADPQTDMALLRLRPPAGETLNLTPVAYGDSSQLRLGDVVLAIGNPFGVGQTVTMGIVSATGRARMGIAEYEDFVQTDAAINPGNSGGALISMRGELVGINTAILSRTGGSHGIGFAIPSNMVRPIIESLLRSGKVVRGWLGVVIQDVTPELATALHLPASRGVIVTGIEPGSPAETAGLSHGDLVEQLDGEPLLSSTQLRNLVATRGAGAQVQLVVVHEGARRDLGITLGERPQVALAEQLPPPAGGPAPGGGYGPTFDGPGAAPRGLAVPPGAGPGAGGRQAIEVAGLALLDLDAGLASTLRVPPQLRGGAVVAGVAPGSPGDEAGLAVGDVIVEVQRVPVRGASQFAQAYARSGGNAVVLAFRGARGIYVILR